MVAPVETWSASLIGKTLAGRYRVIEVLGEGGIGAVFAAEHVAVGRRVALKVLHPEHLSHPSLVERFHREARAAAACARGGVVAVLDLDQDPASGPFLVMEHLEGETLSARLRRCAPLAPSETLRIVRAILDTLEAVHERGIVHRDLKPANVMLAQSPERREVVKLLDFGLARVVDPSKPALTLPGSVLGTPRFMAPEQAAGDPTVDARADLYAVGAILYCCLGARPPYAEVPPDEALHAVLLRAPTPLERLRPDLPAELVGIVARAMAREREVRFADAASLRAALEAAVLRFDEASTYADVVVPAAAPAQRAPSVASAVAPRDAGPRVASAPSVDPRPPIASTPGVAQGPPIASAPGVAQGPPIASVPLRPGRPGWGLALVVGALALMALASIAVVVGAQVLGDATPSSTPTAPVAASIAPSSLASPPSIPSPSAVGLRLRVPPFAAPPAGVYAPTPTSATVASTSMDDGIPTAPGLRRNGQTGALECRTGLHVLSRVSLSLPLVAHPRFTRPSGEHVLWVTGDCNFACIGCTFTGDQNVVYVAGTARVTLDSSTVTARAGPALTVVAGGAATLDGSRLTGRPAVHLGDGNVLTPRNTVFVGGVERAGEFRSTIVDRGGNTGLP